MKRLVGLTLAATALFSVAALAAPERERIRGTVTAISGDMLTVHTTTGEELPIAIGGDTKYLGVVKASLDNVEQGAYIGTATKSVGGMEVALEVVVFPPAMKGTGDGHYPWDKLPDTTLSGGAKTDSTMTNGSVTAVAAPGGAAAVNSTMTNGSVSSAEADKGTKKLTVTYKGGEQTVIVPPTAPVVTFKPATKADVTQGANVFIIAMKEGDKVTAGMIAVGKDGVKPPM